MLGLSSATLISRIITLLIAFTVHEFAHAYTADRFGDTTPRMNGRLTLNPAAHLDLFGTLLLIVGGFGWAKPVPVNAYALQRRSPAALMLVSLAGPASNFLLAILAAIPFRLDAPFLSTPLAGGILPTLSQFLFQFMLINLSLMLFNLLPLAPLDGEKVAEYFFPPAWQNVMERIRPYGPVILMMLFFVLPQFGIDVLGWIITPPLVTILRLLVG